MHQSNAPEQAPVALQTRARSASHAAAPAESLPFPLPDHRFETAPG
jgi:hypothetical protein